MIIEEKMAFLIRSVSIKRFERDFHRGKLKIEYLRNENLVCVSEKEIAYRICSSSTVSSFNN